MTLEERQALAQKVRDHKLTEEYRAAIKAGFSEESARYNEQVGIRMTFYREDCGISREEMADAIGVARSYIYKIEKGKLKAPAYIIYMYCQILNVASEMLLDTRKEGSDHYIRAVEKAVREKYPFLSDDMLKGVLSVIGAPE